MGKLFEWYCRLSPWYQVALLSLYFGFALGLMGGLAFGHLGEALYGFLIGLIIGPLHYYDDHRKQTDRTCAYETSDEYPEDLERAERRHAKQWVVLFPTLMVAGIGISWIVFGTGWYGGIAAFPATAVASWALGRFGGPDDPKWKRVRDEWKRQHIRAARRT